MVETLFWLQPVMFLSFASVYPDSFPAPHMRVFGRHSVNCALLLLSTACAVRELPGTGACFPFPCCCVSSSCARDCVFLTRDMACTTAQEISCVHLIPHGSGACVCLSPSMEARLIALEDRLRRTEEVLVAERLARQTAEAAQQTVGPQPAGAGGGGERPPGLPSLVDTRATGKLPTFSGDVDVNGQPEGMSWSQWSFVFRSYLGAFDPTATRLPRQVETNVEDPVVVDNTSMTRQQPGCRGRWKQTWKILWSLTTRA